MKFLVLLLVLVAVFWWLKAARRGGRDDAGSAPPPAAPPAGRTDGPAVMVACAHCGIHLPRAEALPGPGGVYCSEAHRAAHAAGPGASR